MSSTTGAREMPIGTHLIRIEGDSLEFTARGPLRGDDMRELLEYFVRIKREYGQLFVIYDGYQSTAIEAEARRVASRIRDPDADANLRVAFGLSFAIRVLLSMILRAQKALSKRDVNVHLFDDEQEARTFFIAERAKIRAQFKASKSL